MQKGTIGNIALIMAIIVVGYTPSAEGVTHECYGHYDKDCSDIFSWHAGRFSSADKCHKACKIGGCCAWQGDCVVAMKWGIKGKCYVLKE